ncbi:hypothetical protein BC567DRAFT_225174 [Phyllosticta citribraziliensis]
MAGAHTGRRDFPSTPLAKPTTHNTTTLDKTPQPLPLYAASNETRYAAPSSYAAQFWSSARRTFADSTLQQLATGAATMPHRQDSMEPEEAPSPTASGGTFALPR